MLHLQLPVVLTSMKHSKMSGLQRRGLKTLAALGLALCLAACASDLPTLSTELPATATTPPTATQPPLPTILPTSAATIIPELAPSLTLARSSARPVLTLITKRFPTDVQWSLDGVTVTYQLPILQTMSPSTGAYEWYAYNTISGTTSAVPPPAGVASEVLTRLQAITPNSDTAVTPVASLSPSGRRIIYLKASKRPFPTSIITGNSLGYFPELWGADGDGQAPAKLGDIGACGFLSYVTWFDHENRALIACGGGEGGADLYVANLSAGSVNDLGSITDFKRALGLGAPVLSSDARWMAYTDFTFSLTVVPMDGSAAVSVARYGYSPTWSMDGVTLFYLSSVGDIADSNCASEIHAYDMLTRLDKLLSSRNIEMPGIGKTVIPCSGPFAVSPRGNAAVFVSHGLWLMSWR